MVNTLYKIFKGNQCLLIVFLDDRYDRLWYGLVVETIFNGLTQNKPLFYKGHSPLLKRHYHYSNNDTMTLDRYF